ncbi:MAG: hypothetical protein ACQEV7_07595 [Bacillota bacterium]
MKRNSTKALRPTNSIYNTRKNNTVNAHINYEGGVRDYEDSADYVKFGAIKGRRLG